MQMGIDIKKNIYGIVCILFMAVLSGCNAKQPTDVEKQEDQYKIYYLNNGGSKLVSETYEAESPDMDGLVKELLDAMDQKPKDLTYKKSKPDNVLINTFTLNEEGQITLNFESSYKSLAGSAEILCRAAIVKTLFQIDGVAGVEFQVDGQPLLDVNEKPFGFMTADDFIDNGDKEGNSNQNVVITLFFANPTGKRLSETRVKVKYDGTIPMEQLIMKQLMAGPDKIEGIEEGTLLSTIPQGTVLLNSSIKDGVCYLDFNEVFLERISGVSTQAVIYSVVNSLVEMSNVNKVQFTINGEPVKTYAENTKFDVQFEFNFEILTEKE